MTDPFYYSERWKKKRALILRRAGYKDQLRIREGISINANTVHHIFRREEYPQYEWSDWNLIAVSDRTHKELHKPDGQLSNLGRKLMLETAAEYGIPLHEVVLVIGHPGSGKSTYVKTHIGGGVAFDLDYVAAAFRLKKPHEEIHDASRRMANEIGKVFVDAAKRYSGTVFMVRTSPTIDEAERIMPSRLVYCAVPNGTRIRGKPSGYDEEAAQRRIDALLEWAQENRVTIERYPPGVDG